MAVAGQPMKLKALELRERLYRRRFLAPNLVTLAGMFCGFLSIIYASSGRFDKAMIAIAIAIVFDGLDGRVARKLNATSKFGIEFDSLSDAISFGVAPAILVYNWAFRVPADEFGVIVCFVYLLCTTARLARFNVADPSSTTFTGLPSPGAAGCVAATVNACDGLFPLNVQVIGATIMMLTLGGLMVSRFPFPSIKRIRVGTQQLFVTLILGSAIALVWYSPKWGLLIIAWTYALSGVRWRRPRVSA